MLLLPLLVTALQMQTPSEEEVTRALADGIRQKLAHGWELVDIRSDDDELRFTLVKRAKVEAHVIHFDTDADLGHAYRIDVLPRPPVDSFAPSAFVIGALATGGSFDIDHDCGHLTTNVYRIEAQAQGRAAQALVADTLAASTDVEAAELDGDRASFVIDLADNAHAQLRVTLDAAGGVRAAELRHYENGPDLTTYEGQGRMQQKIGSRVTAIEAGARGVIVRGDKWFEIVPAKFERNEPPDGTCGC